MAAFKQSNPGCQTDPGCQCVPAAFGCPCSGSLQGITPVTLYQHITVYDAIQVIHPCTLVYQPTPPAYSGLLLGASNHFSVATFNDADGYGDYRYCFKCDNLGRYEVFRVYASMLGGPPGTSGVLYTWIIPGTNNYCHGDSAGHSFQLETGHSSAAYVIVIDEHGPP